MNWSGRGADLSSEPSPPEDAQSALIESGLLLASELGLPALLRRLVEIAVRITGVGYGAMGVVGTHGGISEFITVGISDEARAAIGPIPHGRGILGALLHDPRPLRLARLQDDPRSVGFPPNHPPMTSFLGAPVRARGRVFGNLYLTEKRGGAAFNEEDEATVVTLAAQAGVAIANAETYAELRQRERWLAALHGTTAALLAGRPQQTLMSSIVESARELSGADLAAIALAVDGDPTRLRFAAAAGLGSERVLAGPGTPGQIGLIRVPDGGRSLIYRPQPSDPYASALARARVQVGVLMVVPLLVRDRATGTIVLTHAGDASFTAEDLSLVESFAGQAVLALDYAAVQSQAQRLAVVEERHRIARDLHDEPIQALIYLARRLESLALGADAGEVFSTQLEDTRELAVAVADGLRQLTEGLRSEILEHEGLPAALTELADRFSARVGIPAAVAVPRGYRRPPPELERSLLRVAQEALSNVERHARAARVRLQLSAGPARIGLRISDDGVGFPARGPGAAPPGLGTIGMRERVELLGGRLTIRSRPGRGTVVMASLPRPLGPESPGQPPRRD